MTERFCPHCGKVILPSRQLAEKRERETRYRKSRRRCVYKCKIGNWHMGRPNGWINKKKRSKRDRDRNGPRY